MRISLTTIAVAASLLLAGCAGSGMFDAQRRNDILGVKRRIADGESMEYVFSSTGNTALLQAIDDGHIEMAKMLIKSGANVNAKNPIHGHGPLAAVFWHLPKDQQYEMVKLLIQKGADVNAIDRDGNMPIHRAVSTANVSLEAISYLIKNGADVNQAGNGGLTPLIDATMNNTAEVVDYLISKGAKVNQPNYFGRTPLMNAYYVGSMSKVKLLLSRGANPAMKDSSGRVATDFIEVGQQDKVSESRAEERRRQDKEDSRAFWKGAATLATGVAVGNSTRNLSSDQQTRMMKSSMEAVDSGDASGFTDTSRQVRGEQAQAHQAKMREIEAQKERERARERSSGNQTASSSRTNNTEANTPQGNGSSPKQEKWKPAFTASWEVCKQRALETHLGCANNQSVAEAYTAAEASASAQSKLCSKAKQKALNPIGGVVVEELGCGCHLGTGQLSCAYYTLWKGNGYRGTGGGRAK